LLIVCDRFIHISLCDIQWRQVLTQILHLKDLCSIDEHFTSQSQAQPIRTFQTIMHQDAEERRESSYYGSYHYIIPNDDIHKIINKLKIHPRYVTEHNTFSTRIRTLEFHSLEKNAV
jgi:hypothetical protein